MSEEHSLEAAVARVSQKLRLHAAACLADPSDVGSVVRHGEALREAVLAYEAILSDETGWSSPLRHLDDDQEGLVEPDQQNSDDVSSELSPVSVKIDARYYLRVNEPADLTEYVRDRFGVDVNDVIDIVRIIYKSDGWDPEKYPAGLVRVDDIGIDVYIED